MEIADLFFKGIEMGATASVVIFLSCFGVRLCINFIKHI